MTIKFLEKRTDQRRHFILKTKPEIKNLTPEEYFIWEKIKDGIRLRQLIPICPWAPKETLARIESMIQKGAAFWHEPEAKAEGPAVATPVPPELQKIIDSDSADPSLSQLDLSFRLDVLRKHAEPEGKLPYEILETYPRATPNEIKAQYLKLSKKFHPDRFFSKELGHYKPKLDLIFTRIQKAYSVLKNPIEREALDRTLAHRAAQTDDKSKTTGKRVLVLDKEMEKFGKSEFHYKAGLELEQSQDFVGAYNAYVLAYQIDPHRDVFQKAMDRIKPEMFKQKAGRIVDDVEAKLKLLGPTEEFVRALDEAIKYDGTNAKGNYLLGRLILDLSISARVRDAKEMLRRAKASLSRVPDAGYQLARTLHALGEDKLAIKELKEVLQRDPQHSNAKKLLDKLK